MSRAKWIGPLFLAVGFALAAGCDGGDEGGCTDEQIEAAEERCQRCLDSCSSCTDPAAACISSCRPCDE